MNDWQTIAALVCIAVAAIAMLRRVVAKLRSGTREQDDAGCGTCRANPAKPTETVNIDMPTQRR